MTYNEDRGTYGLWPNATSSAFPHMIILQRLGQLPRMRSLLNQTADIVVMHEPIVLVFVIFVVHETEAKVSLCRQMPFKAAGIEERGIVIIPANFQVL